ncbi:MAG: prepilin-type N-terminal cleavage/methylation domain-containing protein [Verrucomicrobiota bacterium]
MKKEQQTWKMRVQKTDSGLTLIELLVVLSIVAVLSTVALRGIAGNLSQTNYEANLSQLEEIEKAIIGDDEAAGFLGDIGRLPQVVGSDPETQLSELWIRNGIAAYSINTAAGDSEIKLGTGWRGPYLNLGLTRTDLTDGFNGEYLFSQPDETDADMPGETIAAIVSLGLSGTSGGVDYEEDVELIFQDATENRWQTDLQVTVVADGGQIELLDGANLIVRAYGADASGGLHTVIEEKEVLTGDIASFSFTLTNLPYGAKVLRAYQEATDPATKDTAITTAGNEKKSPVRQITINRLSGSVTLTLF